MSKSDKTRIFQNGMHLCGAGLTPVCLEMTWSSRPSFLGLQVQQGKSCTQISFHQALGLPCLQAGGCGISQHPTKQLASGLRQPDASPSVNPLPTRSLALSFCFKERAAREMALSSEQSPECSGPNTWPQGPVTCWSLPK